MFEFFRRYQKYFYIFITIIIVISFSFFGTYGALDGNKIREKTAFTAINGRLISVGELENMTAFIGSDNLDKKLYGGAWGPNFLNDGVIRKDFLETGLAQILIASFPNYFENDLDSKLEKEKKFVPYAHPQAKFISANTAWHYFSPDILTQLDILKDADQSLTPKALDARVKLFLAEKSFSPPTLRQVLRYQQRQYNWIPPDENLDYIDLSLFSYHNINDWFGPKFTNLISEFVMNAAILAEEKGYQVTSDEALADLIRNAQASYKENKDSHPGIHSSGAYFAEQLRRMGLDQTMAVKIWKQVLLFRLLFQDIGNSVFVDTLTYKNLNHFANETVEGDLYQLPESIRLQNGKSLLKFETYLNAIAKRTAEEKKELLLPSRFNSLDEVKKRTPELYQKNYLVELSHVSKKDLQAKVSIKDTWNWETEDPNWNLLAKKFPDIKSTTPRQDRLTALDGLDNATRSKIDVFARANIVDSHPEWIQKALDQAKSEKTDLSVRLKGKISQIQGITNPEELITLLDQAPIGEVSDRLSPFTADNQNYYRIKVLQKPSDGEILTFTEASQDHILDDLLDRQLEIAYVQIRQEAPETFQNIDKSWKPYEQVKDLVVEQQLKPIVETISKTSHHQSLTSDEAARMRFLAYMSKAQTEIKNHPETASNWLKNDTENNSFEAQWKLIKSTTALTREANQALEETQKLFALTPGSWSGILGISNGNLYFFKLTGKGNKENQQALVDQINKARALLSDDAQRTFLKSLIPMLKEKNAISLTSHGDYTSIEPEKEES